MVSLCLTLICDFSQGEVSNWESTQTKEPRFAVIKLAKKYHKERWIVRDTQPNPGDRIKRLGTIGELRRIPINADNLKNKDKLKEEDHANQPKLITAITLLPGFDSYKENEPVGGIVRRDSIKKIHENSESVQKLRTVDQNQINIVNGTATEDKINQKEEKSQNMNSFHIPNKYKEAISQTSRTSGSENAGPHASNSSTNSSSIEELFYYLKEKVITQALNEYSYLRDQMETLEREAANLREENRLLHSIITSDQKNEFENKLAARLKDTLSGPKRSTPKANKVQPVQPQNQSIQNTAAQAAVAAMNSVSVQSESEFRAAIPNQQTHPQQHLQHQPLQAQHSMNEMGFTGYDSNFSREMMHQQIPQSRVGHENHYSTLHSQNYQQRPGFERQNSQQNEHVQRQGVPHPSYHPTSVSHSTAIPNNPNLYNHFVQQQLYSGAHQQPLHQRDTLHQTNQQYNQPYSANYQTLKK
jgi:hypothetical protein